VLTNEIIAQTRRFAGGVRLDEETLALAAIDEVGPGGHFLNHDHTMAHWRQLWLPTLFDRQRLEPWLEQGAKPISARVREQTVALLDSHQPEPLPPAVTAEIETILAGGGLKAEG
jgi:trimethylamine---corrinoid protein Co-methyltransferase